MPRRLPIHRGLSRGAKVFLVLALVLSMLLAVPLLGLIAGAFASLADPNAGWVVGTAVVVVFAVPLVVRLLWVVRSAAWLDGTILVVRGALTTRRCDLATATGFVFDTTADSSAVPVAGGMVVSTGRRIPRLVVHDANGKRVRLRLHDPATRRWFPPATLNALADAIVAGRGPAPDGSPAWQTAATLRTMAADPAGPRR